MRQRETLIRDAIAVRLSSLKWMGRRACLVSRRFVGKVRAYRDPKIVFNVGTEGQADLHGILCTGRAFECEVKTESGRLSSGQRDWIATCEDMGALAIVVKSDDPDEAADEAERVVMRAIAEDTGAAA